VAAPLTKIYNKSLNSGCFPLDWKRSNVTPVHKGGSCDSPGNFRPISVVPIVAKIFEKIVGFQLSSYFETHQLYSAYQGAYRKGKSTEQLLMVAVDTIVNALDKKLVTCVAFLDLRKAFDSLDHVILLQRLNKLGVCGTELAWFTDYLTSRLQRIKFNNDYSEWGSVNGGIPQGSALGPLLFLVYMNDMPSQIYFGKLLQYADDTALICTGVDYFEVQRQLSEDLKLLSEWLSLSRMQLNIAKSSVMWFKPKSTEVPPVVYIDNILLKEVTVQKYLGVHIDNELNWIAHVSAICKKLSYYLFWINTHRKCLSSSVIKMLVDSLVFPRMDYALPVWGTSLSQHSIQRLQNLQNWAIRITMSLRKYDHVSQHRLALGWLPVATQVRYRSLCAMHHQYCHPQSISLDPPILFGPQHSYRTRCPSYFANLPRCALSFTQSFFRYSASKWWNNLPQNILSGPVQNFSTLLYNHLLTDS